MPRLITIPISHYGERARWALDYAGVTYEETHHLQFFSWAAAKWHGGRRMVPLLLLDDGTCLNDSSDIVRWASDRAAVPLYPADPAERREMEALEQRLLDFGVETRRVTYSWFLADARPNLAFNLGRAPAYQRAAFSALLPVCLGFAKRYLRVLPEELTRGEVIIRSVLGVIAERMSDGRRYLFGDRFTAADLTFATMCAAILAPAEYGVPLPSVSSAPSPVREKLLALREHPACQLALRLYREDRRRVSSPSA